MNLYNQNFEKINKYIDEDRTILFLSPSGDGLLQAYHDACELAVSMRSYVYKVLNNRKRLIGYGVPR